MDARLAQALIEAQFPEVQPTDVSWLGEGYDSTAFDVNGEWVFRFPKRPDVEQQLLLEVRLLPVLVRDSPLQLPAFCFTGAPSPPFPRHFGGYRKVPGDPAIGIERGEALDRLAPTLGAFLSWLHAFPLAEARRLGVSQPLQPDSAIRELQNEALEDFAHASRVAPDLIVGAWLELLRAAPIEATQAANECLVHGDLAAEHVLYDAASESLTGVIDWSDVAIGEPSIDLAGVFHWGGERLLSAVVSSYRGSADAATMVRARYRAACRGIGDVVFGIELGRGEYITAGRRALDFAMAVARGDI